MQLQEVLMLGRCERHHCPQTRQAVEWMCVWREKTHRTDAYHTGMRRAA